MIEIKTDSTCNIPKELVKENNIQIIPHLIIWGDDQYRDRVDLSPQAFYQR